MKRWIVALAGLMCVLGPGALYSFSLFSAPLAAAFGWTASEVTWAFAIANFFLAVGALFGGILSDRFGPRFIAMTGVTLWGLGYALCGTLAQSHNLLALYAFYGVVGGLGCGITYISALSAVLKWFPERRGFGGGLVIMGFGLGSFVYSSIVKPSAAFASISSGTKSYLAAQAQALSTHVPFDASKFALDSATVSQLMSLFVVSGIAFFILGTICAFILSNPPSETRYAPAETQFTLKMLLGDARFYVIWAMLFLNVFGGITIIANMVPIMRELTGMDASSAAGAYALLAVFNGLGRFVWGWLSDHLSRRVTFALLFGGQALAFFALDGTRNPIIVSVAIATLLLCYGGGFGVMPAFNADFFGTKNFGANYGAQLSAWGLAAVFGTYFISTMKALSGSYAGLMQPISIVLLVAIFFPLIIETPKKIAHPLGKPVAQPA